MSWPGVTVLNVCAGVQLESAVALTSAFVLDELSPQAVRVRASGTAAAASQRRVMRNIGAPLVNGAGLRGEDVRPHGVTAEVRGVS